MPSLIKECVVLTIDVLCTVESATTAEKVLHGSRRGSSDISMKL